VNNSLNSRRFFQGTSNQCNFLSQRTLHFHQSAEPISNYQQNSVTRISNAMNRFRKH
jgi:hypothetical protein